MSIDRITPSTDPNPAPPSEASPILDEAFERMSTSDFELPNGFVNHGPMACEALAALGQVDEIDGWARRFTAMVGKGPTPSTSPPLVDWDWQDALGSYDRLPEWLGYFDWVVADTGWSRTVELWVPRLLPGLASVLFHGAIRTAQAVRAVAAVDSAPRRAELARSLAYWAARFRPGQPVTGEAPSADLHLGVANAGAHGAGYYLARPDIFNLHGVTGAMAIDLLIDHIPADAGDMALAQVHAEHAAMHVGIQPVVDVDVVGHWDDALAPVAAVSHDAHQVKMVEACDRGWEATGDRAFVAAAATVSGWR